MPRISRYHKFPLLVFVDKRGQLRRAMPLRIHVRTTGSFEHVLNEQERLDHLATKYYREPRAWWQICDANPEFLSPLALIGREPITTVHIPLRLADATLVPNVNRLLNRLRAREGVQHVTLTHTVEIQHVRLPDTAGAGGTDEHAVWGEVEFFQWAVTVVYNRVLVDSGAFEAELRASGIQTLPPTHEQRVGKRIIIPPDRLG